METGANSAPEEDNSSSMLSVAESASAEESEVVANPLSADYLNFDRDFKPGQQRHLFDLPLELRNMIYELVVVSPEPVTIYKEYHGCSLTLVNRQVRAESLPIYLQRNSFHLDRGTDISYWVKSIGEENLLSGVRKLVVDIYDDNNEVLLHQDVLVHPIHASERGISGICLQHLGDHYRCDGAIDVDEYELSYDPTFTDILRVANNILWLDDACDILDAEHLPDPSEMRMEIYKGISTKPPRDPQQRLRNYIHEWIDEAEGLVEDYLDELVENVRELWARVGMIKERIRRYEQRLQYRVD